MVPIEKTGHLHFLSTKEFKKSKKSLLLSMGISFVIIFVEGFGAYQSKSLALLSDTFHIFMDLSAHVISFVAILLSMKSRTFKFPFGLIRVEILAAFLNSILLILLCFFLLNEAIQRILEARKVDSGPMLLFSLIGLFLNSLSAYILFQVSGLTINLKSAYLHALGDLLGTFSVVLGAILIRLTDQHWIDTLFSFLIVLIIGRAALSLLKESGLTLLDANPDPHRTEHILADIQKKCIDAAVLDWRHWGLTSGVECFECRILIRTKEKWESVVTQIHQILKEEYGITHACIEPVTKESKAVLDTIHTDWKKIKEPQKHSHPIHIH